MDNKQFKIISATPHRSLQHEIHCRLSATLKIALLAILGLIFSTGCGSGKLTRDKAESLITARLKSSPAITNVFITGKQSSISSRGDADFVKALVNKGMMSYTYLGRERWNFWMFDVYDIEVTAEGLKYKVGETRAQSSQGGPYNSQVTRSHMRMADQVFVAITGIRESQGGESAQVDFTWKYANITPFGEVAPLLYTVSGRLDYSTDKVRQGSVTFTKFDDGWRLPNPWSLPVQRTAYE